MNSAFFSVAVIDITTFFLVLPQKMNDLLNNSMN